MFLATLNKPKQLLLLSFIDKVGGEQLIAARAEITEMITELKPGFRVLTDMGRLDSISVDCGAEIGRVMELCDEKGVGLIVRVIPDPRKDIGLNILGRFHYRSRPRTVTCDTMAEAANLLSVS
jgi:hypothetical protein